MGTSELRVGRHIVNCCKILNAYNSITCLIKFLESEGDERSSAIVKLSSDGAEELVVVNLTIVVLIEVLEDTLELGG
jgi:hypothetical protein